METNFKKSRKISIGDPFEETIFATGKERIGLLAKRKSLNVELFSGSSGLGPIAVIGRLTTFASFSGSDVNNRDGKDVRGIHIHNGYQSPYITVNSYKNNFEIGDNVMSLSDINIFNHDIKTRQGVPFDDFPGRFEPVKFLGCYHPTSSKGYNYKAFPNVIDNLNYFTMNESYGSVDVLGNVFNNVSSFFDERISSFKCDLNGSNKDPYYAQGTTLIEDEFDVRQKTSIFFEDFGERIFYKTGSRGYDREILTITDSEALQTISPYDETYQEASIGKSYEFLNSTQKEELLKDSNRNMSFLGRNKKTMGKGRPVVNQSGSKAGTDSINFIYRRNYITAKSGIYSKPIVNRVNDFDNQKLSMPTIHRTGDKDRSGKFTLNFDDTKHNPTLKEINYKFETKDTQIILNNVTVDSRKRYLTELNAGLIGGTSYIKTKNYVKHARIDFLYNAGPAYLKKVTTVKIPTSEQKLAIKTNDGSTVTTIKELDNPNFLAPFQNRWQHGFAEISSDVPVQVMIQESSTSDKNLKFVISNIRITHYSTTINYPTMLPVASVLSSSLIKNARQQTQITAEGYSVDSFCYSENYNKENQDITPYDETRINIEDSFSEIKLFQQFDSPVRDKTTICIPFNNTVKQAVFKQSSARVPAAGGKFPETDMTGFCYYNWDLQRWEQIGLYDHSTSEKTDYDFAASGSFGDYLSGSEKYVNQFSSIAPDYIITDETEDFSSEATRYKYGLHKTGTPTIHGFAPNANRYHATGSQSIRLSNYISEPFYLECAKLEIPFQHTSSNDTSAQKMLREDNYSFFLYRQSSYIRNSKDIPSNVKGTKRYLICSGTATFNKKVVNKNLGGSPYTYELSHSPAFSHGYNNDDTSPLSFSSQGQIDISMVPAVAACQFSGLNGFRSSSMDDRTVGDASPDSGFVLASYWPGGTTYNPFHINLNEASTGYHLGFGEKHNFNDIKSASLGRDFIKNIEVGDLNTTDFNFNFKSLEQKRTLAGETRLEATVSGYDTNLYVTDNIQSNRSPYLLLPNDELILGIEKISTPIHVTYHSLSGSRLELTVGGCKLTLIGSLVKNKKEKNTLINQNLTSLGVSEMIHNEINDDFHIFTRDDLAHTYTNVSIITSGGVAVSSNADLFREHRIESVVASKREDHTTKDRTMFNLCLFETKRMFDDYSSTYDADIVNSELRPRINNKTPTVSRVANFNRSHFGYYSDKISITGDTATKQTKNNKYFAPPVKCSITNLSGSGNNLFFVSSSNVASSKAYNQTQHQIITGAYGD